MDKDKKLPSLKESFVSYVRLLSNGFVRTFFMVIPGLAVVLLAQLPFFARLSAEAVMGDVIYSALEFVLVIGFSLLLFLGFGLLYHILNYFGKL